MKKSKMIGYGVASISDSCPYNFIISYFLFFLISVADIPASKAGTIASSVILIDAVLCVVIGYISDNTVSEKGRRIPYMRASAFLIAVGILGMFTSYPTEEGIKIILYVVSGSIFWMGFAGYYTPYTALGAELTDDYTERSILRSYARIFGIIGNFIGAVLPLVIVDFFIKNGLDEGKAWMILALLISLICFISIIATCNSIAGMERKIERNSKTKLSPKSVKNLFSDFIKIIRVKPFKYLLVAAMFFIIANTFFNSSIVFFANNIHISENITSSIFLVLMISNLIFTPLIGVLAVKINKKCTMVLCMILSGVGAVIMFKSGIETTNRMYVYVVIFSVSYACFWQLNNSLIYDLSEIVEYKYDKHMEGSISSIFSIVFTLFTSFATKCFGFVVETEMYSFSFILVPGICLIMASVCFALYPVNPKKFNILKEAISAKRNRKEYDISALKRG